MTESVTSPAPPSSDTWHGDACSLVDAFRSGERSPFEELVATFAAIDASDLSEQLLLDLALIMERIRPWPLVAKR